MDSGESRAERSSGSGNGRPAQQAEQECKRRSLAKARTINQMDLSDLQCFPEGPVGHFMRLHWEGRLVIGQS